MPHTDSNSPVDRPLIDYEGQKDVSSRWVTDQSLISEVQYPIRPWGLDHLILGH